MPDLKIENLHVSYGLSHIVFGVSMTVMAGEIVCLLGRNGVGKTTTLQAVMGVNQPGEGMITFNGKEIAGKHPYQVARAGIGYVPEDRRIFRDLTVLENLNIGATKGKGQGHAWDLEKVYTLFPRLQERLSHRGSQLSGGEQQMLAIARSLMGNPELLLLDEPTQGLAPILQQRLAGLIKSLKDEGITILLAEQSLHLALQVSDRFYVMEKGLIKFECTRDEINDKMHVVKGYLGV